MSDQFMEDYKRDTVNGLVARLRKVEASNAKLVAALKEVEILIKEDYPNRALHVIRAALKQSMEKP